MRRPSTPWLAIPLVCLLLFSAAAPCLAAESPEHAAESPVRFDATVALVTIVVFLLLLVVLTKFAWKPILAALKAREEGIRASVEGAEKANADAKALLEEHRRRVAAAADEARAIVEEGRKDAEALRARLEKEAVAQAGEHRDRALRDIDLARDAALKELHERVAVLATDVAGRILQARLDPAAHRRLVDEAVSAYERDRGATRRPGGGA